MKMKFIPLMIPLMLFISCTRNNNDKSETTYRQLKFKKRTPDSKKKGYFLNLEEATIENYDFRSILYTGKYMQLALMSLEPGEDIGWKTHVRNDQFLRVESGTGLCLLNDEAYEMKEDDAVFIPAGARHNLLNNNDSLELKIHLLCARPVHKDKISRSTKEEAKNKKERYDGETTE